MYGLAKNPWNPERATGGSSGGEGGLVATHCTPFGIATDAVGSVRIPAGWCGAYGFRSSFRRYSKIGRFSPSGSELDLFKEIFALPGTITRSYEDLEFLFENTVGKFAEFDPFTVNYPFNKD